MMMFVFKTGVSLYSKLWVSWGNKPYLVITILTADSDSAHIIMGVYYVVLHFPFLPLQCP